MTGCSAVRECIYSTTSGRKLTALEKLETEILHLENPSILRIQQVALQGNVYIYIIALP